MQFLFVSAFTFSLLSSTESKIHRRPSSNRNPPEPYRQGSAEVDDYGLVSSRSQSNPLFPLSRQNQSPAWGNLQQPSSQLEGLGRNNVEVSISVGSDSALIAPHVHDHNEDDREYTKAPDDCYSPQTMACLEKHSVVQSFWHGKSQNRYCAKTNCCAHVYCLCPIGDGLEIEATIDNENMYHSTPYGVCPPAGEELDRVITAPVTCVENALELQNHRQRVKDYWNVTCCSVSLDTCDCYSEAQPESGCDCENDRPRRCFVALESKD